MPSQHRPRHRPLSAGAQAQRPDPLAPPAGGQVLICCAQPRTDVVLDL